MKLNKLLFSSILVFLSASLAFGAKQNTYTTKSAPVSGDKALIADSADANKTKQAALSAFLVGDCTGFPCLDGTSDGGNIIKLYAGTGSYWTALQGGAPAANRSWRLPIDAPPSAGTTRLMNMDEYGQMGFVDPATFATPTGSAASMTVDASGFNGNLATTDNTLQEIAQKVDDMVVSGGAVSDTAYGVGWNGDTTTAPSKNAIYDKIETIAGGTMTYPGAGIPQSTGSAWGTSITAGTGVVTAMGNAVNGSGGFLTYDADLITWAGITPGTGIGTWLATPSGANLASALTSALPASKGGTGLTSLGTGVATAMGNAVDATGGFVTYDADLADLADGSLTGSKVSAASDTAVGVVELATTAEVVTGTDTTRAVTAAGVTSKMAAPGAIGGTTPAAGTFTTVTASSYASSAADGSRRSILPSNTTISPSGGGVVEIYNEGGAIKAVEADTEYDVLLSRDIGSAVQAYDADLAALAAPTAWRLYYSNGSSAQTALAFGAANTFMVSGGASSAPSFYDMTTSINSGAPNGTGAKIHWSQLTGVPAGFADGSDDGSGGGITHATSDGTYYASRNGAWAAFTSGNYTLAMTLTGNTAVTLPTSGTLATVGGDMGAATATTATAGDNDTSVATTAFVQTAKKSGVQPVCAVIPAAVAADDYPIFKAPAALTITAGSIHVYAIGGTNVVGGLDECTGTNGTCSSVTAVDSDITGTAGSDVTDDGTLTNGGIASGNWIQWHTTSVSGTNTSLSVCFSYTLD